MTAIPARRTPLFAKQQPPIPLPVLAGAVAAGLFAAAAAAYMMRPAPKPPSGTPAADSAAADTAFDVRWQGQRKDGADCIGTFEVTRGTATGKFIAFVMDSSGGVMGGDSTDVTAVSRGKHIDLRFRGVNCAKIGDWQLQVLTPKATAK